MMVGREQVGAAWALPRGLSSRRAGAHSPAKPMHTCVPSLCLQHAHSRPPGQSQSHGQAQSSSGRAHADQGKREGKTSWPFLPSKTVAISIVTIGLRGSGMWRADVLSLLVGDAGRGTYANNAPAKGSLKASRHG